MALLSFLIGLFVEKAYAQNPFQQYCQALGTYCGDARAFIIHLATRTETLIVQLIGGAAVLAVIYGSIQLIVSGGDDSKREESKKIIITALIGLVLAITAHAVVLFVADFVQRVAGP